MENIVLCGSMKVKDEIMRVYDTLMNMGYNVLLPLECIQNVEKSIASRAHFDRICDKANNIVLVVNTTKNGIENYIGPNSLAEIAFAFYFNKEIYLLNDIYEPYKDELKAWKVNTLNGNIELLKK